MIVTQVRRDRTRKTGSLGRIERQRAEIGPSDWLIANLLLELNLTFEITYHREPIPPCPPHQQVEIVITSSNSHTVSKCHQANTRDVVIFSLLPD
jgi:hypothetical protein